MDILDHSVRGFKELAGCKIYLLPHQVNTIMRCLEEEPCRFMLADEVGMGKTVEAISVLKIYLNNHSGRNALIVVPRALKKQWLAELLIKFDLTEGEQRNHNMLRLKAVEELALDDLLSAYDFVIVDEVHRCLTDPTSYENLHMLSKISRNVLLLSATPVQQRGQEYLSLMRLLAPEKYDAVAPERFGALLDSQNTICQKITLVLDDLDDYEGAVDEAREQGIVPNNSDDCTELFEEISEDLNALVKQLNDPELAAMVSKLDINSDDAGVYAIRLIVSCICGNYQIESHVIRNRRRILEDPDDGIRLLPVRVLRKESYELDRERNSAEALTYEALSGWIEANAGHVDAEATLLPLLSAFSSSARAFSAALRSQERQGIAFDAELKECAHRWLSFEEGLMDKLRDALDDPFSYEAEHNTRLLKVLDLLYDELYDQKVVLFTDFPETFTLYREALGRVFEPQEFSCFGEAMNVPEDELERNAYRFQSNRACRIMLCDRTGGEGRNFQCADVLIHIDLPWNASLLEQRIGRLDRLERDPKRGTVTSIVVFAEETFEHALFDLWDQGLSVFTHSLSGMEIFIGGINSALTGSLRDGFTKLRYEHIPRIIKQAARQREEVRREQQFDVAAVQYQPMYAELRRTIDYYNQNDNTLFATTMTGWASLAGFEGMRLGEDYIAYSPEHFSPRAAANALFTLPDWDDYISGGSNAFSMRVLNSADGRGRAGTWNRTLYGTFRRKQALENDYLHFFAPGDALFDAIVNNALLSSKGQVCAMAAAADINWKGIIVSVSAAPDEGRLYEHGISPLLLNEYRNALPMEQLVIPYSIENPDDCSDDDIRRAYRAIIDRGFQRKDYEHLGRRSGGARYLRREIPVGSCLEWFRRSYPPEQWRELLTSARRHALEEALQQTKRRANLRGVREDMERTLSARQASERLFGLSENDTEKLKRDQAEIMDALRHPRFRIESAAMIWMIEGSLQ